jgi:Xaa-Pro aminopeptidase
VARLGVDAAFPIGELAKKLPEYLAGATELYYETGRSRRTDRQVHCAIAQTRGRGRNPKPWPKKLLHPELCWHELRLIKQPEELALMRRAAAITTEAHLAVMREGRPGKCELDLDATLRATFMRGGAERPAYPPIVGSGPNATVLHYRAGKRQIQEGELVLVDAGCEYEYYASDVTRTFPADGRFSPAQRRVYEAVLAAQLACIAEVKAGSNVERIHQVSMRTVTEGLVRIGLLAGSIDELIENESYKRYFMHRTSHWLGMDVHDVGAYFLGGEPRRLEPGMVLTVEPGIYIAANDEQAPAELRGIGVRIEDDVLVREDGNEVLTAAIPKSIEDVERACRG